MPVLSDVKGLVLSPGAIDEVHIHLFQIGDRRGFWIVDFDLHFRNHRQQVPDVGPQSNFIDAGFGFLLPGQESQAQCGERDRTHISALYLNLFATDGHG